MDVNFEDLERLRKLGIKRVSFAGSGMVHEVEFFPEQPAYVEASSPSGGVTDEVDPATGLTREQAQIMFNMPR